MLHEKKSTLSEIRDNEPVSLAQLDTMLRQIEENLVDGPHIDDHVNLTRLLAKRILIEKPEKWEYVKARLNELRVLLERWWHAKQTATQASWDTWYTKIPDNVVAFRGKPEEKLPQSENNSVQKKAA